MGTSKARRRHPSLAFTPFAVLTLKVCVSFVFLLGNERVIYQYGPNKFSPYYLFKNLGYTQVTEALTKGIYDRAPVRLARILANCSRRSLFCVSRLTVSAPAGMCQCPTLLEPWLSHG